MDMIDFKHLTLTNKPNDYLVCPHNYCDKEPNETALTYPVSVENLKRAWDKLISEQPRVKLVNSISSENRYQYVQRTFFFRFPDYIDVQFISLSPKSSTLAIYSRARYGHYDFHVNEKRVKNWLSQLPKYFASSQ